ncbi:mannose/cellobiose epimerase-like protein (N-acyl-D-glucosamine 2-epimerase family) [Bacillus fengqiuensis]|nr:mannose/cellobiose epimerase-like protein (N-acyl-D-glucosamine 2-epimerase family) [Bacillus fengqiuensis]
MTLSANDHAIIEQALKAAAANSADYQEIYQYEDVLKKLKRETGSHFDAQADGFRYDYDDSE